MKNKIIAVFVIGLIILTATGCRSAKLCLII